MATIRYGIGCAIHGPIDGVGGFPDLSVVSRPRRTGTVLQLPDRGTIRMALWDWLLRWFGWSRVTKTSRASAARSRVRLRPTGSPPANRRTTRIPTTEVSDESPYRLARMGSRTGQWLDLTLDHRPAELAQRQLPNVRTPDDIADWLNVKLSRLAWLVHHFSAGRAESPEKSHYFYHWIAKSRGGWRLIEAPKQTLKEIQRKILTEVLEQLPPHPAAHGFRAGRSIVTNAQPHAGQFLVLKWDLRNFYPSVGFSRVTAIFRSMGYSREAAIWLARLTTTALPANIRFPQGDPAAILPYLRRHLPQGAPTSPALANLSAYGLDVRLSGLARSFGANYTRYADDLTFSGDERFARSLKVFIPLVAQICRQERFRLHPGKRRILRAHQRQQVTGVVVNRHPNVRRRDFDQLKAVLTNCLRHGPAGQNREQHENFAAHLQGRIAHVMQLNRVRGEKLANIYARIDWQK
ncbi:MAG: reverse transcriptase family protein [Planctomycetaceae bacterium]